jgi:uncharacterized RDD family membrane protein YckC
VSDHYELLGVDPEASRDDIRAAYRERLDALKVDPNAKRQPSEAQLAANRGETALLNSAWHVLSDPFQRQRYDANLAAGNATDADADDEDDTDPEAEPGRFRDRMRVRAERTEAQGGRLMPDPDAAPLGRRLGAVAIDVISVVGIFAAIFLAVASQVKLEDSVGAVVGLTVGWVLVCGIYSIVPTVRRGQTFGQSLAGVRVVTLEDRATPNLGTAVVRYAPICGLPIVLGQLGPMLALLVGLSFLFASNRVSLLDRLAKTRVIRAG